MSQTHFVPSVCCAPYAACRLLAHRKQTKEKGMGDQEHDSFMMHWNIFVTI